MKRTAIKHEFVEFIPDALEEGTLYVSVPYATAVHKCCCGCGREVVTPLSPTDWELRFDGRTVSLYPSIGSWALPCQSHYWIRRNRVIWARRWSFDEIERGRADERREKQEYFEQGSRSPGQGRAKRLKRRSSSS
jgi:hypothetical protein